MEKLEEYFAEINGREFSVKEEQLNKAAQIKNFLRQLKTVKRNSVAEGASKSCQIINGYAVLKSKDVVSKADRSQFEGYDICCFSEWLIKQGVKTPKMYSLFYADKHYYEVFEQVKGTQISITSMDAILKGVFGVNYEEIIGSEYTPEQRTMIGNYIYDYNRNAQKQILKLEDRHFDELLASIIKMGQMGFVFMDTNPGNIIATEDGFVLIDIDYNQTLTAFKDRLEILTGKKCTTADVIKKLETNPRALTLLAGVDDPEKFSSDISENFIFAFCSSCWYSNFLEKYQQEYLHETDTIILKKVVNALTRAGIYFDIEKSKQQVEIFEALGRDYTRYYEVVESQIPAYQQKKTMR